MLFILLNILSIMHPVFQEPTPYIYSLIYKFIFNKKIFYFLFNLKSDKYGCMDAQIISIG